MSGGVDSCVAAKLLKDEGHDVRCVFFVMSDAHVPQIAAARAASGALSLPFEALDLRGEFGGVIDYFCREYCAGRTPNPCVVCNPTVKFKALCDAADAAGSDLIATGHYARVEKKDGVYVLRRAECVERDQSYMLYSLSQAQLARLVLPLGGRTKAAVRDIADAAALPCAAAPDSQEICFIPDGDYPAYIAARGYAGKKGNFIAPDGRALGPHKGVEHYTVGQRRGLHVSLGAPVFVKEITAGGDILLGFSGDEYSAGVRVARAAVNPAFSLGDGGAFSVKLRSMAQPAGCRVEGFDGESFRLVFDEPQRAPAPGQAAVLYHGEYLVGGGVIEACF